MNGAPDPLASGSAINCSNLRARGPQERTGGGSGQYLGHDRCGLVVPGKFGVQTCRKLRFFSSEGIHKLVRSRTNGSTAARVRTGF